MNRKLIAAAVVLTGFAVIWAIINRGQRELRDSVVQTRHELRARGFRTDLSDFNLAAAQRATNEVHAILAAAEALRSVRSTMNLRLKRAVGNNAALLSKHATGMDWEALRRELEPHASLLDEAGAAAMRGGIAFEPDLTGGMKVSYAAEYKRLAQMLSARAVLAMRDCRDADAARDCLALSRLVTAWNPEPVEISHLVRFSSLDIAHQTLWESMHNVRWTEEQLTSLQREWESARLWQGLPEIPELTCANMLRLCQTARTNEVDVEWGSLLMQCVRSPGTGFSYLWSTIKADRAETRYRKHGTYEDERALMLYFRDRKAELQQAVASETWEQMKYVPGVTNFVPFDGATNSRVAVILNLKSMGMSMAANGRTLTSRAVESEARRRIIVTALALQRFKLSRGEYPKSLRELVPTYLNSVPRDVIDGQELRYHLHDGGSFVLYAVGLDGVDNGGTAVVFKQLGETWRNERAAAFRRVGVDIVWPRLASREDETEFEKRRQQDEGADVFE